MKLIFVDTETTGLDAWKNEIFQISAVIEVNGEFRQDIDLKMRPLHPHRISEEAMQITGKTPEELATYPHPSEILNDFKEILKAYVDPYDRTDKFIWVGQNAPFDIRFTRAWFKNNGDKYFGSWFFPIPADLISLAVACTVRGIINPPNYKLKTLCDCFQIPLKAHDALHDVRATRAVWKRLLGYLNPPLVPAAGDPGP